MYQKDKIYNGLSEFSFEELRAIKYWRLKKEREVEAERLRKEGDFLIHPSLVICALYLMLQVLSFSVSCIPSDLSAIF